MSFFDRFRPYPEMRRVVVNLKSGTSFRGIVWDHAGPYVLLRQVEMIHDRDNMARKAVDGEVAVLRGDVDFIQVLEGGT